jgi:ketosteroid isomerase-like protein
MSESRRIVMVHALEIAVGVRTEDPSHVFTADVTAWSPNLIASSLEELEEAFNDRNAALGNLAVVITGLDVIDNKAFAEWVMEADHVGPLVLEDVRVEPTGARLQLGGATIAEFEGHRIRAFRTYFDTLALLEQMIDAG